MRKHLVSAILVVLAGLIFRVSATEWLFLLMAVFLVIALEIVNSAIENVVDLASNYHFSMLAKNAKDMAAGAVLVPGKPAPARRVGRQNRAVGRGVSFGMGGATGGRHETSIHGRCGVSGRGRGGGDRLFLWVHRGNGCGHHPAKPASRLGGRNHAGDRA